MKLICSVFLSAGLLFSLTFPVSAVEPEAVHASLRSPQLYIDGTIGNFLDSQGGMREPITYNGTVYIPLTTAALWMGADAAWDRDAGKVTLTSNGAEPLYHSYLDFTRMGVERLEGVKQYQDDMRNGIDVQLLPHVTVIADGHIQSFSNVLGEPVFPLLFRECVYLPIRGVAKLLNKQVVWLPSFSYGQDSVRLYDAPTQEELTQAYAYLSTVRDHLDAVRTLLTETYVVHSDEEFTAHVRTIQAHMTALEELPDPTFLPLTLEADWFRKDVQLILRYSVNNRLPENLSSSLHSAMFRSSSPDTKWRNLRDEFVAVYPDSTTYFLQLEETCARGEAFLAAVEQESGI